MKIKILPIFSLFISFFGFSQTQVYFKYDEAGNQRYRGPNANAKQAPVVEDSIKKQIISEELITVDEPKFNEKYFWSEVRIYPVPVKDVLTLDWTDKADDLISNVSLYQHNTIHWVFKHENNLPGGNNTVKIDMTGRPAGVYILTFVLKDGKKLSKNIIKH